MFKPISTPSKSIFPESAITVIGCWAQLKVIHDCGHLFIDRTIVKEAVISTLFIR